MHIKYEDLEWDETKRKHTLKERGLDFADVVQADWDQAITLEDVRQPYPETRYATFAPIRGRLCVFAWCWRGQRMRIISLRKANAREERKYGDQKKG
ncbi:BrnT family toxin [Ruegeria sp. HKCCD8929]|uniref:BrnT family toxin n=1 Tax=Ruegeria sp. HKCCD8929 TaxID=2683006 RepID=UPI001487B870|nr:BrnT family toxin [Ruegeria sp. HKCCD8929]